MEPAQSQQGSTRRDVDTLRALGLFMTLFSLAVLAGSFWPMSVGARVVNTVAGLILLGCGVGFLAWARSTLKRMEGEKDLKN